MSSGRANASAIQRRTASNKTSTQPAPSIRGNYPPQQQQQYPPQQQYINQQPNQNYQGRTQTAPAPPQVHPKLSVSDAIALITIRLGRVETFINALPPLDQLETLGSSSAQEGQTSDNMRIVDEAVFNSIVSRLERLEKHNIEQQTSSNKEEQIKSQIEDMDLLLKQTILKTENLEKVSESSKSENTEKRIQSLDKTIGEVKDQLKDLQCLMLNLQNFTMSTNQKLCKVVFNNEITYNSDEENDLPVELSQLFENHILHEVEGDDIDINAHLVEELVEAEETKQENTNDLNEEEPSLSINI